MQTQLQLGDIPVDVVWKDIKNIHLSVHPPAGRVTISAPVRISLDTVRLFAVSKLNWIRNQQAKLAGQERESPREFIARESHFVWGKRYLLKVIEKDQSPSIVLTHSQILLRVRPGTNLEMRRDIFERWHRQMLRAEAAPLIERWQPRMGVLVRHIFIRRMKTKWGSCNYRNGTIRLNTDLVRKPRGCLEYVVVHEMIHLLEPSHNSRFIALMDQFLPHWKLYRQQLNQLSLRNEDCSL